MQQAKPLPWRCKNELQCVPTSAVRTTSTGVPPVHHEFAVDAMQDRLQVVPLARVLAVEELQYSHHKRLQPIVCSSLKFSTIVLRLAPLCLGCCCKI